jgi:Delta7-sterol 5-desaturase
MAEQIAAASWGQLFAAATGFFALGTLLFCALGCLLERSPAPRIWALPLERGQLRHELIGNLVYVAVTGACFTLALGSGAVRFSGPSPLTDWTTFFALMFGFQIYYYGLHRLLHRPAWLHFHRWHHVSRVTTPLSAQSMSWFETLGWAGGYVLLPALVSRVVPISAEGWAGYMLINMAGNMTGHANLELIPKVPRVSRFAWFANPSLYHALHHARWKGHYGFQSVAMDRLFGSEWEDWPTLHARISQGRALDDLRARGGAE